ncbi:hypothetical protein Tco_0133954 [Tanacetum coccineum]
MSSPCQIKIAHRRRTLSGATIGEMTSVDGVIIVGGAGRMGAAGISEVEVVCDDDPDGEDGHDATLLLYVATIAS